MTKKQLFRLNKVICEEKFVFEDNEIAVPIVMNKNYPDQLPIDSKIDTNNTKATVTVQSCKVEIVDDGCKKIFVITIEFLIIKKIVIIRPGMNPLKMEFSFIKLFRKKIKKCNPNDLHCDDLKHLTCRVWEFEISDKVFLNPSSQTFDDRLIIKGIVKIETEVQLPIIRPKAKRRICQNELATAVGKIRQVIPTGRFKDDLLGRLLQVNKLLKKGLITESLTVLSTVVEKLMLEISFGGSNKKTINLAIDDLLRLKQCILDFLEKQPDCKCDQIIDDDQWEVEWE